MNDEDGAWRHAQMKVKRLEKVRKIAQLAKVL